MKHLYINHILAFLFLVFGASSVWADRTITNATFDPTQVQANENINTTVTVLIDGNTNGANGRWGSTKVKIGSEESCIDHANEQGAGTHTRSFNISTSNLGVGVYSVEFTAYSNDSCGGQDSDLYTSSNAITVVNSTPPPPTGDYRYTACQWSEIFEDYTFDGWNNYRNGVVSQSTEQQKYGAYSLRKSSYNDPHGGWKSLGQSVERNYVLEGWFYRPSNSSGGAEDRIAISDSNFNGYGFRITGSQVFIERRNAGNPQNISSRVNWNRPSNQWYRFRFKANSDDTFTLWIYNENGTQQLMLTSNADTSHSGNFDRVVVHGGHHYYTDGLSVRTCGTSIELDLSVSPLIVNAGAQFRVDINISNGGPDDTNNLELTFPFGSSNGISPSSQAQGDWTCATNPDSIVCSDGISNANHDMIFSLDFNTSSSTQSVTNQDVALDGGNASDSKPISFTINKAPVVNNTHFEVIEGYRTVGNFDISDPEDDSFDYYLIDNNATMFNYTKLENFSFKDAQEYKEDGNNTYTFDVIAQDSKGAISRTTVTVEVIEDIPNYSCPNPHSPSIAFFDTINGGSGIFGNTALCQNSGGVCAEPANNTRNNSINMMFADVDGDSSTFQSTSANVEINGTILWAGLYWQGFLFDQNTSQKERTKHVKLKTPDAGYADITADIHSWIYYGGNVNQAGQRFYYQGFKDITSEVQAGGSGTYTVADILTATGRPVGGSFGAWAIAYAYQNNDMKLKNITIFDSFQGLVGSGDRNGAIAYSNANSCNPDKIGVGTTIDSIVDGFLTPHTGAIDSSLFVFAGEGDIGATGDRLYLADKNGNYQQLSNAANPANDIFNASITYFGTHLKTLKPGSKNPDYQNNLGIDIDTFDVSSIIQNEQTHTTIRLTTNGDGYQPAVYGFETLVQEPDIRNFTKSAYLVEVDGSRTALSGSHGMNNDETIEYWLDFNNSGQEIATNVEIYDDLDSDGISSYADYVSGSVSIEDINNIGASYSCGNNGNKIFCRISRMDVDDRYIMKFQVKTKNISCDNQYDQNVSFSNTALSSYYNIVTGMRVNFSGNSNLNIAGTICPYPNDTPRNGNFTVVDSSGPDNICNALDDWHNNITTKLSGATSTFWILAKDSTDVAMADANITSVKLQYFHSHNGSECIETPYYQKEVCLDGYCGTTDSNGCLEKNIIFESRAAKCVEFYIAGVDGNSNTAVETNSTSIDSFAIRPNILSLHQEPEGNIIAESNNTGFVVSAISGYDQSFAKSSIKMTKYEPSGDVNESLSGILSHDSFKFNETLNVNITNLNYSDVGRIGLWLEDTNWTSVDQSTQCYDNNCPENLGIVLQTGLYGCNICSNEENITIIADRFNVLINSFSSKPGSSFAYYENNLSNQYAELSATVTAFGANGGTMNNYSRGLYSNDTNLTIDLNSSGESDLQMNYLLNDTNSSMAFNDLINLTLSKNEFISGEAALSFKFNFERSFSAPKTPLFLNGLNLSVLDSTYSNIDGSDSTNHNVNFYYGRVKTTDIETTQNLVEHSIEFEVYDPNNQLGFEQNSLSWSKNENHTSADYGEVRDANASISTIKTSPTAFNKVPASIIDGKVIFNLAPDNPNDFGRYTMHLNTSPWLWYAPASFGEPYDESVGSSCLEHPCFTYIYKDPSKSSKISSGEFMGSDAELPNRENYIKKGVKVFR